MIQARTGRATKILVILAGVLMMALLVVGCGKDEATTTAPAGDTALESLTVAQSALSTIAPEAKLLLVQTAESVSGTASPVWAYLFGSPTDDKTYVVYVVDGAVMSAGEYGTAGLPEDEWPLVPDATSWKIDSDVAYTNALEAAGLSGNPPYSMGMITYIPSAEASTTTSIPFTWYISIEPAASGDATTSVQVDAKTGEATVEEQ